MTRHDAGPVPVDATDLNILDLLLQDGRSSIATVAEQVSVSRANAYARLTRLRESGVITGFEARLDKQRLGLGLAALVLISLETRQRLSDVADRLREMPEVEFAAFLTGQYDAVVLVRFATVDALRRFSIERLQSIPGLRSTITSLVLEEIHPHGAPLSSLLSPRGEPV